VAVDGHLMPF